MRSGFYILIVKSYSMPRKRACTIHAYVHQCRTLQVIYFIAFSVAQFIAEETLSQALELSVFYVESCATALIYSHIRGVN